MRWGERRVRYDGDATSCSAPPLWLMFCTSIPFDSYDHYRNKPSHGAQEGNEHDLYVDIWMKEGRRRARCVLCHTTVCEGSLATCYGMALDVSQTVLPRGSESGNGLRWRISMACGMCVGTERRSREGVRSMRWDGWL